MKKEVKKGRKKKEEKEILDVKEIDSDKVEVIYNVLNNKKTIEVKNDTQILLECLNNYIDILNKKDLRLKTYISDKIFYKRIRYLSFILAFTFVMVGVIMSLALNQPNYYVCLLGYIISLSLIVFSAIICFSLKFDTDKEIEEKIIRNENDILKAESLRDKTLEKIEKKKKKED